MVYGPHYSQHVKRIQPVDADHQEDQREDQKRKSVKYQGRSWAETEEELPVQPSTPSVAKTPKTSAGVYADRALLEKAQGLFSRMTTLEEKVAQLFFLETEAVYNAALQRDVELLIQTWQLGGILFRRGNYKRQSYLIEEFQDLSKTPLLIANDLIHGLSFYLQGDQFPRDLTVKKAEDLGKAVMAQNRRIGVHIQIDRGSDLINYPMDEAQVKAFRKGIRDAHGVVGKEKAIPPQGLSIVPKIGDVHKLVSSLAYLQAQENVGFRTLSFFDATQIEGSLENVLFKAYEEHYDLFIISGNVSEIIRTFCKLIRSGKIREEELDRRILRALIVKAQFFNSN